MSCVLSVFRQNVARNSTPTTHQCCDVAQWGPLPAVVSLCVCVYTYVVWVCTGSRTFGVCIGTHYFLCMYTNTYFWCVYANTFFLCIHKHVLWCVYANTLLWCVFIYLFYHIYIALFSCIVYVQKRVTLK